MWNEQPLTTLLRESRGSLTDADASMVRASLILDTMAGRFGKKYPELALLAKELDDMAERAHNIEKEVRRIGTLEL